MSRYCVPLVGALVVTSVVVVAGVIVLGGSGGWVFEMGEGRPDRRCRRRR